VRELCDSMDSREFAEWVAMHMYYQPLPDSWKETSLVVAATLAPHSPRGRTPQADEFVPVMKPPQHESQMIAELARMAQSLEGR
jgi:EAL domain-containing protein (putative c-di-GMP-specific phosphodiesterase class I)